MFKMLSLLTTAFLLCCVNGEILLKYSMNEHVDRMVSELNKDPELSIPEPLCFNISNPPKYQLYDGSITIGEFYRFNDSKLIIQENGESRLDMYVANQKITVNFTHVNFSSPAYTGPAVFTCSNVSFHLGFDAVYYFNTSECDANVTDFRIMAIASVNLNTTEFSDKIVTEDDIKQVISKVNEEMDKSSYKEKMQKEFKTDFCSELKEEFSSNRLRRFARSTSWLASAMKGFAQEDLIESE